MAIGDAASGPDTFTIGSKTYNKVAGSDPPVYQIASSEEIQSKFWEDVTLPNPDPTAVWPVAKSLYEFLRIKGRDEGMQGWRQEGGQLELMRPAGAEDFVDTHTGWSGEGVNLDYYHDTDNWYGRGANIRYLRIHNNLATGVHVLYDQTVNTGGLFLANNVGTGWQISRLGAPSSLTDIGESEISWLTSLITDQINSTVSTGANFTSVTEQACPISRNGTTFTLQPNGGNVGGINGTWYVDFHSMENVAPGVKNAVAVSCRAFLNETYLYSRRPGNAGWALAGAIGNNNNNWRYFTIPIGTRYVNNLDLPSGAAAATFAAGRATGCAEFYAAQAPGDDKGHDMSSLNLLGYWY